MAPRIYELFSVSSLGRYSTDHVLVGGRLVARNFPRQFPNEKFLKEVCTRGYFNLESCVLGLRMNLHL